MSSDTVRLSLTSTCSRDLDYNPDRGGPKPTAWSFDGESDFIDVGEVVPKGGENE